MPACRLHGTPSNNHCHVAEADSYRIWNRKVNGSFVIVDHSIHQTNDPELFGSSPKLWNNHNSIALIFAISALRSCSNSLNRSNTRSDHPAMQ